MTGRDVTPVVCAQCGAPIDPRSGAGDRAPSADERTRFERLDVMPTWSNLVSLVAVPARSA